MITKVTGIIISTVAYGESSLVLNIFTKELGIIGVMAKGVKSLKSRLRAYTDRLTYGYFYIYYKENKLSTLKDVDIIDYYPYIRSDIILLGYFNYITELTSQVYKETQDNRLFDLLMASVKKMEEKIDSEIITNILEVQCLPFLGVGMTLEECVSCGSTKSIVTISEELGGLICQKCYTKEPLLDLKTIHYLRLFSKININQIKKISIEPKIKLELDMFLNDYYSRYTGLYLKSKDFLKKLKENL